MAHYREWSSNFTKMEESLKSDKSRFVRHEDRRDESDLTLENYKGISKGKIFHSVKISKRSLELTS